MDIGVGEFCNKPARLTLTARVCVSRMLTIYVLHRCKRQCKLANPLAAPVELCVGYASLPDTLGYEFLRLFLSYDVFELHFTYRCPY